MLCCVNVDGAVLLRFVVPQIRGYRKNVHYFLTPWEYLDMATARTKDEAAQKGR